MICLLQKVLLHHMKLSFRQPKYWHIHKSEFVLNERVRPVLRNQLRQTEACIIIVLTRNSGTIVYSC